MSRGKKSKGGKPKADIDRWATLNTFTHDRLAGFVNETKSPAAGLLWYVLFTLANGTTGTVRGASVSRLARITGLDRKTVRAAMQRLLDGGAVEPETDAAVPVYLLYHVPKDVN